LFEFLYRDIEHETSTRWNRFEIPDMSHRSSELDVTSSLTTNLRSRDFYTTSFTDNSFISNSLVFSTGTLIVLSRAKDLLTEESTSFWALGTIVDRLRDENLSI
jgi:hypothetical protein